MGLIFAIIGILSFIITLWQFRVALGFPLHRRLSGKAGFLPSLTIIKPVKGADEFTARCLKSWFTQDYKGKMEVIFAVDSKEDPAFKVCSELLKEFPEADARIVVCAGRYGSNAKVSKLVEITPLIKNQIVVVSDADVVAPSDLISGSIALFEKDNTGLVCCFYTLANPQTFAMKWEAIAINADFWSQVLQAKSLKPINFALGAVMMIERTALEKIGGFKSVVDKLADDYWLGRLIYENGYRVELSPVVVECFHPPTNWRDTFAHQLRWGRTIRVCEPVSYFFSILSNLTLWATLCLITNPALSGIGFFVLAILTRCSTAAIYQKKLTKSPLKFYQIIMPPIKDLIHFLIWILAFAGDTIEWRGKKYRVTKDGRMLACGNA
ncbi:MAG: glycosyltransferase [Verrucomicrobiia bacterium]